MCIGMLLAWNFSWFIFWHVGFLQYSVIRPINDLFYYATWDGRRRSAFIWVMCNVSLSTGYLPDSQKKAVVTPVLKKSDTDPNEPKNYQPISIVNFVSKLIERLAMDQMTQHLSDTGLMPKLQSAYRRHHSTETALVKVLSDIIDAADKGQVTLLGLHDRAPQLIPSITTYWSSDYGYRTVSTVWHYSGSSHFCQDEYKPSRSADPRQLTFQWCTAFHKGQSLQLGLDSDLQTKATWSFRAHVQLGSVSAATLQRHQTCGTIYHWNWKAETLADSVLNKALRLGYTIVLTRNRRLWELCLRGAQEIHVLIDWLCIRDNCNVFESV